jgi:hypothetical protein
MSKTPKKTSKKAPAKKAPAKKVAKKKAPAKKAVAKKAPAKKVVKQKTSATPKQEETITITIDPVVEAQEQLELIKAVTRQDSAKKSIASKVKSIFKKK